jgi:hypothetical protein
MSSKTHPSILSFCFLLISLLGVFLPAISASFIDALQPLRATLKITGQRFCQEGNGYSVVQNLDVHLVNQTTGKLIVERTTKGYGIYVARDLADLSKGNYEYHPHIQWADIVHSEEPHAKTPGPDFLILAPGESFDSIADFWVSVSRSDLPPTAGTLQPGNHLLQLVISTWDYRASPDQFRKSWESFGTLVDTGIKTEPLTISLPTDPKVDKCK